jgi:hypothetical protein
MTDSTQDNVTIETLDENSYDLSSSAVDDTATSSSQDQQQHHASTLTSLLGVDYLFYIWTFLLIGTVTYLTFYKYHEHLQIKKRREALLRRQQPQPMSQPPLVIKALNALLRIIIALLQLFYEFF